MSDSKCPICGGEMHFIYGCNFDYDTWICDVWNCDGEIELETTTYPEG